MDLIIAIVPGFTFFCALVMFALGAGQLTLFFKHKNNRSRNLALFCFFTGLFALSNSLSHSRAIPLPAFRYYIEAAFPTIFLASYFYVRSMAYFIIVPRLIKKVFLYAQFILALLAALPIFYLVIFGTSIFFNSANKMPTGNFFMDSYATRLGHGTLFPHVILSFSSLLNIIVSFVILFKVRKSSQDIFLTMGLVFTILASGTEMLLLPFTVEFFVPLLFFSNFFEAFRMNYLVFSEEHDGSLIEEKSKSFKELNIDEERITLLSEQLVDVMETEKIFRDPNLNLERVARRLKVPAYLLTQVLRFGLDTNYSDFINQYRIEDVKKKLKTKEHQDQTILDIAFSSGFNSKSSFNTAFKKITDMTPSKFRKLNSVQRTQI